MAHQVKPAAKLDVLDCAVTPSGYATAAERIKASGQFEIADVDLLGNTHRRFDFRTGTPWDAFRGSFLVLPDWFRMDVDPMSAAYVHQQHRLWATLAGVESAYDPLVHEKEAPMASVDPIRFPGYFMRRDPKAIENAAEHILATGMLMKHAGLRPGQWALEYGAGFAQTALQLARLGVNVDTVDISEELCTHVRTQAEFYKVPLTPFTGQFGWNPRGDHKYDAILFYESFHHCLDFRNVVPRLKRDLAVTGRILLAGEPIRRREDKLLPYPWGLRLDSENVAVVRVRHWFELGFSEDFLVALFTNAGFAAERMECPVSHWGEGYIFRHRSNRIEMASVWLPAAENDTWHGREAEGRWTTDNSFLSVDTTESFTVLEVEATNHHPLQQPLEVRYGSVHVKETFKPGQRKTVRIGARVKAPRLVFGSKTLVPAKDYSRKSIDTRALGIFVNEVRYS